MVDAKPRALVVDDVEVNPLYSLCSIIRQDPRTTLCQTPWFRDDWAMHAYSSRTTACVVHLSIRTHTDQLARKRAAPQRQFEVWVILVTSSNISGESKWEIFYQLEIKAISRMTASNTPSVDQ